jgi:hypothetical protein
VSLERSNCELATNFNHFLGNVDHATKHVDPVGAQAGKLADAKATVAANDTRALLSRVNGVCEPQKLFRRQESHLFALDGRELDPSNRVRR